jgi:hypothetical protein
MGELGSTQNGTINFGGGYGIRKDLFSQNACRV